MFSTSSELIIKGASSLLFRISPDWLGVIKEVLKCLDDPKSSFSRKRIDEAGFEWLKVTTSYYDWYLYLLQVNTGVWETLTIRLRVTASNNKKLPQMTSHNHPKTPAPALFPSPSKLLRASEWCVISTHEINVKYELINLFLQSSFLISCIIFFLHLASQAE